MKKNCWEFKDCGRGPEGPNEMCPVASNTSLNGVHGGVNCGRACWVVAGTYCCDGKPHGDFAQKISDCSLCDFYKTVREEEGRKFQHTTALLTMLNQQPPLPS
jgi:hypothetical protein